VVERLLDFPRSGAADTFTPEQLCWIVALAWASPEQDGRPITHWTPRELADEAIKQGIVPTSSVRQIGRRLRQRELRPHKGHYGVNGEPDERKEAKIQEISQGYKPAQEREQAGELTMRVDEQTGSQARERQAPTQPMRPGPDEKQEFNSDRHDPQALLAGINGASGEGIGECRDPRTEKEFVEFIDRLVSPHPERRKYRFVSDHRNTHKAESLGRYVARMSGVEADLGVKGQKGS
jgi:hypothetical protein